MKTGVAYFGNRSIEYVRQDLNKIKENYGTYVVHTFSEEDFFFYKEVMKEILTETKKIGLKAKLDPWGVAGIFGGETFSKFVAYNLDVRQVNSAGESVPLACPNNPKTIDFLKEWTEATASIGAEEIFWDEPHFYEPHWTGNSDESLWGCVCEFCQDKFRQKYHGAMPKEQTQNVLSFKKDSLVDLLRLLCDYAKNKGLKNSVCLLPKVDSLKSDLWEKVASIPAIDNIGTDPYWVELKKNIKNFDFQNYIRQFCLKIKEVSSEYSKEGHIWIQNFSIPRGWEDDVRVAFNIIYANGIRDIAAWSYMGTKVMSEKSCEDPQKVWSILGDCFKKAREA
jgi:hypothetical protein